MFDLFSIGTSKSNLVLDKKADFTPQNFFGELKGQTLPWSFQRTIVKSEMEKKRKKNLRCPEFCFALSHAAKPKECDKQLCLIPPLWSSKPGPGQRAALLTFTLRSGLLFLPPVRLLAAFLSQATISPRNSSKSPLSPSPSRTSQSRRSDGQTQVWK